MLLCGWHIQRNLISKLSALAKKDKKLYDKIINLPFVTCTNKFEEIIGEVKKSKTLSRIEFDYIQEKLKTKSKWAKSITKSQFCGGVCTTSRIEGLHGVLKRHLNANSSINKVFNCFRQLEIAQSQKHDQEFLRHQKQEQKFQSNPLKEIEKKYPEYIYKKIAPKFSKSLNYILGQNGRSKSSW